jgi:hypothetical protein
MFLNEECRFWAPKHRDISVNRNVIREDVCNSGALNHDKQGKCSACIPEAVLNKDLVYLSLSCITLSVVSLEDVEEEMMEMTITQKTFSPIERPKGTREFKPVMVRLQTSYLV